MKSNCLLPFYRLKLDADGYFQSCCHQSEWYGNIFEDDTITIENIMKQPKSLEVKTSCINSSLHKMCDNERCPVSYNNTNADIDVEFTKYPKEIELAMHPTWCNIGGLNPTPDTACIMCPRSDPNFIKHAKNLPNRTDELVEFIKPAMPHLNSLWILGISEPFYKGKIFDIFDKLEFKKYKETCAFQTVCNGSIFIEKYQEKFLEYVKIVSMGFSIDAATPETYYKIRRNRFLPVITKNLTNYFNKVNNHPYVRDYSAIVANISTINVHEMEDMVRWANDVGAKRIDFSLTYLVGRNTKIHKTPEIICNKDNWEIFWESQLRAEQVGKELNIDVQFLVPFHGGFAPKEIIESRKGFKYGQHF